MASGFCIPPWRSLRRSGSAGIYSKQRARPTYGQRMANTVNTANTARAAQGVRASRAGRLAKGQRCATFVRISSQKSRFSGVCRFCNAHTTPCHHSTSRIREKSHFLRGASP
eukprot:746761-Prymnesium_polylepis.1